MTIPYLMNCDHTGAGWCLACVKALGEEAEQLRAENEALGAENSRLNPVTTLVGCVRCGRGVRPRHAAKGMCRDCAEAEIDRLEFTFESRRRDHGTDPAGGAPAWRDRLVFDSPVSETSPVVKGTWVPAAHVVSLIVDGWTWSDVLRCHPELTEDDIRACLVYTLDEGDRP